MNAVFLADAHLKLPEDNNYQAIISFLDNECQGIDLLVILGDFFEFLIGYPVKDFPHYRPVLDCLMRLKTAGIRIIYCEGNHDFHLGSFFTDTLGAELFTGPVVIDFDEKKTLICHGDQINAHELSRRMLRAFLHGPAVKALIPLIPARYACAIAIRMSRVSTSRRAKKKRHDDTRIQMIKNYASLRFAEGCETVITGHFHLPFIETSENPQRTLLSLGEWITEFNYGAYRNGEFSLNKYSFPQASNPNISR